MRFTGEDNFRPMKTCLRRASFDWIKSTAPCNTSRQHRGGVAGSGRHVHDCGAAMNAITILLPSLCWTMRAGTGFVVQLHGGPGLAGSTTRASDEHHDQRRSWTSPRLGAAYKHLRFDSRPDRLRGKLYGSCSSPLVAEGAIRSHRRPFVHLRHADSTTRLVWETAAPAAPAIHRRTRLPRAEIHLYAVAGGSGGAEVTSDTPSSKPKRRGRPPKSAVSASEQKAKVIATAKRMAASVATTAPAREATKGATVATSTEGVKEGTRRAEGEGGQGVKTVGIDDSIAVGVDEASVAFESSARSISVDDDMPWKGAAAFPSGELDVEEKAAEDEQEGGERSPPTTKARKKSIGGKGAKAKASDGDEGLTTGEMEREETRQDKQAAAIQRQGLKVGAFGKERLVYHNDYVVHEELGFCRYLAPEFLEDAKAEEIMLEFADMNLAIRRDESHLLTRYRAADAARVPLSVVAEQGTWLRHKLKVQERVTKQAINVMDLYAKRARIEREPCRPDGPEMEVFCAGFEYDPTIDQLRCLQEIENDMVWRKVPMDRLLCGDVGFGKTEVAIRAIFRMVRNNKQVALLAPTTILAAQHYRTLLKRMPADIRVALLRGGNTLGSRDIKEAIRNCTVDVVVGTHSLLSRKVEFPNLGLLVIDEEQKFGVNQKEKLKVLSTGVDVLTLTATPIPRTLHMSLTGIRDLSTIFSPPEGRQNVTTYIMKATDDILKRAITREMSRGGQVFVVVPRINQIESAWEQINRCVPEARVAVGHSKVKGLEDVVLQFTLGRGDILLATSIIENGIDMPNVNSIVVMDSHMFGLSQLYQMRGRVGRSNVAAYTYLLYPPGHALTNEAKRRLKAMRELSHLGSGFELANRDLEIRGAGNIFGTDQSGDLKDIGYELYMNMLEKAIVSVRGTDITPVLRCEVDMGFARELEGSVPAEYMTCNDEERARQVERLRVCNSFRELVRIAKEWVTPYGEMPTPVRRLFKHTHLHTACRLLGVSSISLEYLPNSEPCSPVAAAASAGTDEYPKGWAAGPPKNSFASALDHPSSSATAAGNAPTSSGTPPGGVGGAGEGQQAQFQEVGRRNGWVGSPADARERRTSAGRKAGVGDKEETSATAATAITEAVAAAEEVPFAVMRGVDVEQERWEILLRQGPLGQDSLRHVCFRHDAGGVAIRGVSGKEETWLRGEREEWLDHLLSVLLPLVEYVETKQSLQLTMTPPTRNHVA